MIEALEIEMERAWLDLIQAPPKRSREYFLTDTGRVVWGNDAARAGRRTSLGWWNREATLADFRDNVFHVLEQRRSEHAR